MKRLLLAGGTGLVGSSLLRLLEGTDVHVTTVGRRATGCAAEEIITDFSGPLTLPAADVAICALGTTIAAAGSRAAFRAIDHDAVLAFASAAKAAGTAHCIVVTAVGANPKAKVFYSRVKGETESALEAMEFARLDILQPGLLLGPRKEHRPVEAFLRRIDPLTRLAMPGPLDRYAGIDVTVVARAIRALTAVDAPGVFRHQNRSMQHLGAATD